jgi:hypothetical protein
MFFAPQSRSLMVDFLDDLMARRVFHERRLYGAYSTEAERALARYRLAKPPGGADAEPLRVRAEGRFGD